MAGYENPRNPSNSSFIDSVAFGLATLEKHGDQAREVERLVQQISSVRKQFDGTLAELLWATENFLSSFNSGNLNDEKGSYALLQELSRYLNRTAAIDDTEFTNTDEVDELLERLDFLASGGTDQEVPKRTRSATTPTTKNPEIKFPVKPSRHSEDSLQTSMLERSRSTCRLLVSRFEAHSDSQSGKLLDQQLQYLNNIETSIRKHSSVTITELITSITDPIKSDLEKQSANPRIETHVNQASTVYVYKSLANFLVPVLRDLNQALAATTTNRQGAMFEIRALVDVDQLTLRYKLKGIKIKFVELIVTTLESSVLSTGTETEEQLGPLSASTSESIRSTIHALAGSVRTLAGSLSVKTAPDDEITIELSVNSRARLTQVVPVTVDSASFAIEAQLVQAVVPAQMATRDIYRNQVLHGGATYEFSALGRTSRLDQVDSDASGFFVLTKCNSQKSAIHVEEFQNVTELVVRPSSSDVELGSTISLSPANLVQLDLLSLPAVDAEEPAIGNGDNSQRTSVCLCDLSAQTAETFLKASLSINSKCEVVQGSFETIRSIQERRPRILVLEASDNEENWINQLRLARHYTDLSNAQVWIAGSEQESQQSRYGPKFSDVRWIPRDLQVPELVELLTSSLGS